MPDPLVLGIGMAVALPPIGGGLLGLNIRFGGARRAIVFAVRRPRW